MPFSVVKRGESESFSLGAEEYWSAHFKDLENMLKNSLQIVWRVMSTQKFLSEWTFVHRSEKNSTARVVNQRQWR